MAMNRNTGFSPVTRRRFRKDGPSASGRNNNERAPLTHFLCLPIGHHTSLQESVSPFTSGLLQATPKLPGLDRSIVIAPRRLHLTLGVMSLADFESSSVVPDSESSSKTLPQALSLLSTLGGRVTEILSGNRLSVPLHMMHIMQPHGGNPDNAHVLWFGPSPESEDAQRLMQVGEMVHKAFTEVGFITDRRPLKLHCTILNTTYRKPKARGPRQPFSYRSLLASPAAHPFISEPCAGLDFRQPVKVNFGTWSVDEIQICKMGSYGPEGEYVSCGGLSLI
ncbi:hypothetical protein BS17DRAFT_480735 [Gyrodon lividus]|nr:hypothetical protein BS17DRAFT_480735 [Gyrodon lividus]